MPSVRYSNLSLNKCRNISNTSFKATNTSNNKTFWKDFRYYGTYMQKGFVKMLWITFDNFKVDRFYGDFFFFVSGEGSKGSFRKVKKEGYPPLKPHQFWCQWGQKEPKRSRSWNSLQRKSDPHTRIDYFGAWLTSLAIYVTIIFER